MVNESNRKTITQSRAHRERHITILVDGKPGLFAKFLALIVFVILLPIVFAFSLLLFSVLLTAVVIFALYLLWTLRRAGGSRGPRAGA